MQRDIQESVFRVAAQFLRQRWPLVLLISAAILIPCFWHKHIEAGDLGSHVYNAWLAELAHRGDLHGLWVAHQWNNVAFDLMVSAFGQVVSWMWAEKLAVSVCVLIFFWGAYSFVSAASRQPPWFLTPLIAIVSYGWTFQQGFINYYLSLGLSFFALAILWRGNRSDRIVGMLAFVPLICLAHLLGLVWLFGAGVYTALAEAFPRFRGLAFVATTLVAISTSLYVQHHYLVYRSTKALYLYNGADQIVLYSKIYKVVAFAIVLFVLPALGSELWKRKSDPGIRETGGILLQLYLVLQFLVLVLPDGVLFPGYNAPITYLPDRLTTLSAVLVCGLLGLMRPRRWHLLAYGAASVLFFLLLYRDTGIINHMEEQTERLVASLPFGQRVLFTIGDGGLRLNIGHFVDRACIHRCFSYGNYEPSTGQFRIRAMQGNGTVMSQVSDVWQMESGAYHVKRNDLPAYQIYQCGEKGRQVCMRPLTAGEKNDPSVKIAGSPFDVH